MKKKKIKSDSATIPRTPPSAMIDAWREVMDYVGVTQDIAKRYKRIPSLVRARNGFAVLCVARNPWPWTPSHTDIALACGWKSHTSSVRAVKLHANDPDVLDVVRGALSRIHSAMPDHEKKTIDKAVREAIARVGLADKQKGKA